MLVFWILCEGLGVFDSSIFFFWILGEGIGFSALEVMVFSSVLSDDGKVMIVVKVVVKVF